MKRYYAVTCGTYSDQWFAIVESDEDPEVVRRVLDASGWLDDNNCLHLNAEWDSPPAAWEGAFLSLPDIEGRLTQANDRGDPWRSVFAQTCSCGAKFHWNVSERRMDPHTATGCLRWK